MFNKLAIIGVGLIGGSVACAARDNKLAKQIIGIGRNTNAKNLEIAKELGVIDEFHYFNSDLTKVLKDVDCLVIATPVGVAQAIFTELKKYWNPATIYTDAGSTKVSMVEAVREVFGFIPENFVPAHPIAGSEQSGVTAARAGLFIDKRLIITPVAETAQSAVERVTEFWQQLGAQVSTMNIKHHDEVLAATSHLPHVLAYALVDMLGKKDQQNEIFKYAAGGFKDFTRIASSDPTMWLDICMANRDEIVPLIHQLKGELTAVAEMLEAGDSENLFNTFNQARIARQRFLAQYQ
jgi:prephenate dehydrogenase